MIKTATPAKSLSPRDERVAKQRAVDVRVKRLGKIVILAEALKNPKNEAFVSFGIMGSSFVLDHEESKSLAGKMMSQALAEHRADQDADPLPKELEWVLEIVDAGKPKSPSITPQSEEKGDGQDAHPTKGKKLKK